MLLLTVARLKTKPLGYVKVIAQMCGLLVDECKTTLKTLTDDGHIHYVAAANTYAFWTAGASGNRLDKEIQKYLEPTLDIDALNKEWATPGVNRLSSREVGSVVWGSPKDYEAQEYLLTRSTFTAERLRRMAAPFRSDPAQGMTEARRGYLFWLVAETEDDISWFDKNVAGILDEALPGDHPPPVVVALPSTVHPRFISQVLRAQAFHRLPQEVRHEYGEEVLRTTADRYRKAVDEEMWQIQGETCFEVPSPYRAALAQQGSVHTATRALEVCYQTAYHSAPAAFFTNYSLGTTNLRRAVCLLGRYLSENRMGASGETQSAYPVARELVTKYLRVGLPSSWGLVSVREDVQPPIAHRSLKAWEWLDAAFKPGQPLRPVRDAIVPLFNAPFGYDYHHVLLLLSAWYGYHQQYMVLQDGSQRTSISALLYNQDKPKDVILHLCRPTLALCRKDKNDVEKELTELLQRMQHDSFTRSEAQNVLAHLKALVTDEKLPENQRVTVQAARERVERSLARAEEYAKAYEDLQGKIEKTAAVTNLVLFYKKIVELPKLMCVTVPETENIIALRQLATRRLKDVLATQCSKYEQLKSLEDYSLHHTALDSFHHDVGSLGQSDLLARIKAAQEALEAKREILKQGLDERQHDTAIIAELRAIQAQGPLVQLRKSLARLHEFSPRAQETTRDIQSKREALQNNITQCEAFISGLPARLDGLMETAQARKLLEDIYRRQESYSETPEANELQAAQSRCSVLEEALKRIVSYRSAASAVKSPSEIELLRVKIARTQEQVASMLSEGQAAQFTALANLLNQHLATGRRAAQVWLAECQRQSEQPSSAAALLTRLDTGHPYITESEVLEVEALRAKARQSVDENEVEAIKMRFRRIADPAKRRACLAALQDIAALVEA